MKHPFVNIHNSTLFQAIFSAAIPASDEHKQWLGGGDRASALTQPVIQCLLDHTTDYVKSAMLSAQVLLGVTPTILAILSSSYKELALPECHCQKTRFTLSIGFGKPWSLHVSRIRIHRPHSTPTGPTRKAEVERLERVENSACFGRRVCRRTRCYRQHSDDKLGPGRQNNISHLER